MQAAKYETHIAGPVQGFVQGDQNVVTLIFPGGERRTVPFMAPPQPSDSLVGRDELLRALKSRLLTGTSLALLSGLPGVGKTALAVALAHDPEVLAQFQDGVLWAGLGHQPDVLAQLSAWGMAVGLPTEEVAKLPSVEERAKAVHAAIGLHRMLLVADDAWQVEAALAFKVGGPHCTHLLTTRLAAVALDFADDEPTEVHELSEAEGLQLLARLAPAVVQADPEAASALVQAVGGLPLALNLLGRYLRKAAHGGQPRRLRAALERFRQAEERLGLAQAQPPLASHPSLPQGAPISLQAAIAISDAALDEASRRALQALAVFPPKPNTFSEEAALAASGATTEALDLLTDCGLLEPSGIGRYTLHQTIADYARVKGIEQTAYERMVAYFVGYVEHHATDYPLLDLEISNILAAWQAAFDLGMPQALVRGATACYPFMKIRGLQAPVQVHLSRAEQAARAMGDAVSLMTALDHLGQIAADGGDYAQAETYLQEGLALARELAQSQHLGDLLRGLGVVAERRGDYARAEAYFQEGLTLARELGQRELLSALLQNLGSVAGSREDYARAEAYFQEGLTLARELGQRERLSFLFRNLGVMAAKRAEYAQAEAYFEEGLALARAMGHRDRISDLLALLGTVALRRGDYARAEAFYQEGLDLASKTGRRDTICFLRANLGALALRRGDETRAEADLREALMLARAMGHRWYLGSILSWLGELHLQRQQWEAAAAAFHEVQQLADTMGVREFAAEAAYGLARLAEAQGDIVEACRQGQVSLAIFEAIRHSKATEVKQWLARLPAVDRPR
jgi:tetratricopeptide (TPR) repeat protein